MSADPFTDRDDPAVFLRAPATLTHEQMMARLREAVAAAGSQRAFGRAHGLSGQYVHDVLHGDREAGPAILAALGLERVRRYREITGPR